MAALRGLSHQAPPWALPALLLLELVVLCRAPGLEEQAPGRLRESRAGLPWAEPQGKGAAAQLEEREEGLGRPEW